MAYDFDFINHRLSCGAQINTSTDMDELRAVGITHIIDCCEAEDRVDIDKGAMAVLWNPTADDGQPKDAKWFGTSIDFALGALAHPGFKVHTHCAAGVNRGPSTAYAILRALGCTDSDCMSWLHVNRPVTVGGVRYATDAEEALARLGWL